MATPFVLPGWDVDESAQESAATIESSTPQKSPENKPFILPGWDDPVGDIEGAPHGDAEETGSASQKSPSKHKRLLVGCAAGALLVSGIGVGLIGLSQQGNVLEAQLPPSNVQVNADFPVSGKLGNEPVDTNAGPMSVDLMEPNHYFIPSLGVYSKIHQMNDFSPSRYEGFRSLDLPSNPEESSWYSEGGPLANNGPGSTGTTLLASHVSWKGKWGVLANLYTITGGEMVYTKDSEGNLAGWKITTLYSKPHTQFPSEYFSKEGERQLVLTTCGEYDASTASNTRNIFAVAIPVDASTGDPLVEDLIE